MWYTPSCQVHYCVSKCCSLEASHTHSCRMAVMFFHQIFVKHLVVWRLCLSAVVIRCLAKRSRVDGFWISPKDPRLNVTSQVAEKVEWISSTGSGGCTVEVPQCTGLVAAHVTNRWSGERKSHRILEQCPSIHRQEYDKLIYSRCIMIKHMSLMTSWWSSFYQRSPRELLESLQQGAWSAGSILSCCNGLTTQKPCRSPSVKVRICIAKADK